MRTQPTSFLDWNKGLFQDLDSDEKAVFLRGVRGLMDSPVLARALAMVEAEALKKVRNYQGEGAEQLREELEVLSGLNAIRKRFQHLARQAEVLEGENEARG